MSRHTVREASLTYIGWAVQIAPCVLAAMSAYYLFLIIIPFFLLHIHLASPHDLSCGAVDYLGDMGLAPWLVASIVVILRPLTGILWVLSLIHLARNRRWWVVVVVALSLLPIAYYFAGPHATSLFEWLAPD